MYLAEGCGDGYERSDFHLVWHSRSGTCIHATISQPSLSRVPIATLANLIPRAIWQIGSELPPTLGVALGPDNFSYVTVLVTLLAVTIMSLEAARDLSIPDLLRLLNEKLGLECTRLREIPLPPLASVASSESEVNTP